MRCGANPQSRVKGLVLIAGCLLYASLFQDVTELPVTFLFFGLMYLVAAESASMAGCPAVGRARRDFMLALSGASEHRLCDHAGSV